jgi:hypothetical protein
MAQLKYKVEELPTGSIWEHLKYEIAVFSNTTEWLVFDTKLHVAEVIKSRCVSKTLLAAILTHEPALLFVLSGDVLKLTSLSKDPSVKPLKNGLVYGIKLYKGVNLQDPAVHKYLTNAIKTFAINNKEYVDQCKTI